MSARWWIESKDWKKRVLFCALVATAVWLCFSLPAEAYRPIRYGFRRAGIPLPVLMFISWSAGWFFLLFVRVEDTSMLGPIDYAGRYRFFAMSAILAALILAAVLCFAYLYRG